jgi:hypothetical protein
MLTSMGHKTLAADMLTSLPLSNNTATLAVVDVAELVHSPNIR